VQDTEDDAHDESEYVEEPLREQVSALYLKQDNVQKNTESVQCHL